MYTLAEKKELEKLINKCKDLEGKTNYNYKRKKHVPKKPKLFIVFIAAAVRNFHADLLKVKHDDSNLEKKLKFAKRCHEKYLSYHLREEKEPSKKRLRESGGGRKAKVKEVEKLCFNSSSV